MNMRASKPYCWVNGIWKSVVVERRTQEERRAEKSSEGKERKEVVLVGVVLYVYLYVRYRPLEISVHVCKIRGGRAYFLSVFTIINSFLLQLTSIQVLFLCCTIMLLPVVSSLLYMCMRECRYVSMNLEVSLERTRREHGITVGRIPMWEMRENISSFEWLGLIVLLHSFLLVE